MMEGVNGYEFVRRLRADLTLAATEVVFCTATYDEDEVRGIAKRCGVSHVLITPCEPDHIIRVVTEALDSRGSPGSRMVCGGALTASSFGS